MFALLTVTATLFAVAPSQWRPQRVFPTHVTAVPASPLPVAGIGRVVATHLGNGNQPLGHRGNQPVGRGSAETHRGNRPLGRPSADVLLTAEEEHILALDMQTLRRWTTVHQQMNGYLGRDPTHAEWAAAIGYVGDEGSFGKALAGLRSQRERLIVSNLRLVSHVARKYRRSGMCMQDIIQEGSLGLITAAERFDPAHGCRFSTYSCYWIQMRIGRLISTSSRLIRIPARAGERLSRVKRLRYEFMVREGRWPTLGELAQARDPLLITNPCARPFQLPPHPIVSYLVQARRLTI